MNAQTDVVRRLLLSGNEAVALAAAHAGVRMATGYPGTPSTEILETLAGYGDRSIAIGWAPNEKVALEVALGAAFAGARALVTMKHVGLNVAADPLVTSAYTGVRGGLVVVTADDPGMHSSQNEQDSRHYARLAGLPMLEPADSQEAYAFARQAFELSERLETPVLLRLTTRISHSKSLVEPAPPEDVSREYAFRRDIARFVMVPGNARKRRVVLQERLDRLREFTESTALNEVRGLRQGAMLGVVASGVACQYVHEVGPDMPVLKVGMCWPPPLGRIAEFRKEVGDLLVIEELGDFLLTEIRAAGIAARGKATAFQFGELNADRVRAIIEDLPDVQPELPADLPAPRPPVLCPGCGHRSVFAVLKKLHLTAMGDIGCYTLGALPPLGNLDSCVCMGASVGLALGIERVADKEHGRQVVGVIGDSTFFHSGMTGVLDAVYNGSRGTLLVLDNRTTAMTGGQDHPGTGRRLDGAPAPTADVAQVCRGLGVRDVHVVDPYDRAGLEQAVREAVAADEYSVIVCRRPCVLAERPPERRRCRIDADVCTNCGACLRTGCPALRPAEDHVEIDAALCRGCGLCADMCRFGAVQEVE
jgi:indolepyruvate ferredoxin oxidoreductase alpha subunit